MISGTQSISRRRVLEAICLGSAAVVLPTRVEAAAIERFMPAGSAKLDHDAFDGLLRRYVKPDAQNYNRVDYRAFRNSGAAALKAYIQAMLQAEPSKLSRDEAHAYWINLYNAKTLDVVLDHYPVKSIRDLRLGGGGLFKTGPWSRKLITVEGIELSLDDIEHNIVRALFSDPMSHYGLNCASYSCPNLAASAYTGKTVNDGLARSAKDYVNHPRGLRIAGKSLFASKIYSWYADDFGGTGRLKTHWKAFAEPPLARSIEGASIDGYEYDWSLNDV